MAPALDLGEYAWYSMVNALAHNRDAFDKNYFLTRNANLVRPCGDVRHGISDINVQDSRSTTFCKRKMRVIVRIM